MHRHAEKSRNLHKITFVVILKETKKEKEETKKPRGEPILVCLKSPVMCTVWNHPLRLLDILIFISGYIYSEFYKYILYINFYKYASLSVSVYLSTLNPSSLYHCLILSTPYTSLIFGNSLISNMP